MTSFDYCSDLHLDFDQGSSRILEAFPDARSPYLILAGDVVEIEVLLGKKTATQTQVKEFFEWVAGAYKKVFWVFGNHEYYDGCLSKDIGVAKNLLNDRGLSNIEILENTMFELDDVVIFGATFWTSCQKRNPVSMRIIHRSLSDYLYIHKDKERQTPISPEDTIALHEASLAALEEFAAKTTAKKKLVITHHAPHIESIPERYKTSTLNAAFYEEMFYFIEKSDIHTWIHGHLHNPVDYPIASTRIVANPRGYYGRENTAGFVVKRLSL